MYKDKDKQREANKQAKARQRARQGMTEGRLTVTPSVIPLHPAIIATINRLSTRQDGTLDEQEQYRRIAIATAYEHLYPGRPYTGWGL